MTALYFYKKFRQTPILRILTKLWKASHLLDWQNNFKFTAFAKSTVYLQNPTMAADNMLDNRQTQITSPNFAASMAVDTVKPFG